MINWLKAVFLKKYLKGLLDDLPFNWRKTTIGVLTLAIAAVLHFLGENSSVGDLLRVVFETLAALDARDAGSLGALITAFGILHKWLKAEAGEKKPEK